MEKRAHDNVKDMEARGIMEGLYEKLNDYSRSDHYPFHMPGHKRNNVIDKGDVLSPYLYDITEIDGFDNLHHPEGILKSCMEKAASYYQSKKTFYLINGSTCGILAAISAACERKKTIVMARNSHKSSYNAVFLQDLQAEYLYPDYREEYGIYGGVSIDEIKNVIENVKNIEEIGAVFLTSPTYEGVVSDIRSIAEFVHSRGIPLIVDEAHGAHFGMCGYFPKSALQCGADVVIQSLHKTLPSLTQTAVLHVSENSFIDVNVIAKYLSIFQTSSPSYVLMSSIERCIDYIYVEREHIFREYVDRLDNFREKCRNLKYFKLYYEKDGAANYDYDKSKLVIIPDEMHYTGKKLYDRLLDKYHLQMEMASEKYVIGMTSVNDTEEGFERLYTALEEMERDIRIASRYRQIYSGGKELGRIEDREFQHKKKLPQIQKDRKAVVCKKIRDAYFEKYDKIDLSIAKGKISQEYIYLYPPGVPILAPGEIITEGILRDVEHYLEAGLAVLGLEDESCKTIKVVQENWKPVAFF